MYCMTYFTPDSLLYTINNMSGSVNNSNFTRIFFKHTCHTNPGADKNEQDLTHIL